MLDWLDRQRQKPKEARRRVAFSIAIGVTALLVLVWAVSLPARFSDVGGVGGGGTNGAGEGREGREMFDGFNTLLEEGRNELENTTRELQESPASGAEPNEDLEPSESPERTIPDRPSAFDTATYSTTSPSAGTASGAATEAP